MACSNCSLTNSEFNVSFLSEQQTDDLCPSCQEIRELIMRYAHYSRGIYVNDLCNFLIGSVPINIEGRIRLELARYDLFMSGDLMIAKVIRQLDIEKKGYLGKSEIFSVTNKILTKLIDDFSDLVQKNPKGYLIALIAMLEYNSYVSVISFGYFDEREALDTLNQDQFCTILMDSMRFWDASSKENFYRAFKHWEGRIASDKTVLQLGIEITNDILGHSNGCEHEQIDIWLLLYYMRAMIDVITVRDEASNELLAVQQILITGEGSIEVVRPEGYHELIEAFPEGLYDARAARDDSPLVTSKIIDEINQICKQYIWLDTQQIDKLASDLMRFYNMPDYFLIGSLDYFVTMVRTSIPEEDETVILSFLQQLFIRDLNCQQDYVSVRGERKNRSLRKCLIPVSDNLYVTTVNMFILALKRVTSDILSRRVGLVSKELEKGLNEYHKMIDTEFEKQVHQTILAHITSNAVHGVPQKIKGYASKQMIPLPREMDVLVFCNSTLYVLECKNFPFKFTLQALGNELQSLRKRNKDSIAEKMRSNLEAVEENWEAVLQHMGVDPLSVEKTKPVGVIVTRDFTIASITHDTAYPIVPFNRLLQWFSEQKHE